MDISEPKIARRDILILDDEEKDDRTNTVPHYCCCIAQLISSLHPHSQINEVTQEVLTC